MGHTGLDDSMKFSRIFTGLHEDQRGIRLCLGHPNKTRGNPNSSEDFFAPELYLTRLILYNKGQPKPDFQQ
jgi:hypothetical protein